MTEAKNDQATPMEISADEARAVRQMAALFIGLLDSVCAPNYLEIPLADESGKVIVIVTLQRPDGDRAAEQVAKAREESARLRAKLDAVLSIVEDV